MFRRKQCCVANIIKCAILTVMERDLEQLLADAFMRRTSLLAADSRHRQALRLFNGFTEGAPELVIDLLGRTAVIHDYAEDCPERSSTVDLLLHKLDFLQAILLKRRNSELPEERNGVLLHGEKCDSFIEEHGVCYALDLTMNHDNSFYGDTRNLRQFLLENMQGKRVLNTFAYTGSLGVAAAAGGAAEVIQTDLSGKFMQCAYRSASLNGFAFTRKNFLIGDFFPTISRMRKQHCKFDCVILDPPFFSSTSRGVVDLAKNPLGVINKVRPLVADNGWLIVVNNSLYLSGAALLAELETICGEGCLEIERFLTVPDDYCFCSSKEEQNYPADPAPFNHPTKIVLLKVHCR
ncbi:MAG: SAM-dependent methyltransferase [Lentisphaerae bacterium]|nr:SAM-dependent methyltransferase [Lentisphaerota bacterium]